MQTIIGHLVRDAQVNKLKDGREVVNFTIAKNERFKPKGQEVKKIVKYFDCSFWMGTNVAEFLTKGVLIEAVGEIGANAWINKDGEAKAGLTMHVNKIELHGKPKNNSANPIPATPPDLSEPADDLPF